MTSTQGHAFDPARAAGHYREALLRIVDMLFALIGLDACAAVATLPRFTRNYLLRILRPAESAARRLIVVAAREVKVALRPASGRKGVPSSSVIPGLEPGTHSVKPTSAASAKNLPLLDTLKRFDFVPRRRHATTMPRVRSLGGPALPVYMRLPELPEKPQPAPGDPLDATRLCARLHALKRALEDIPGQAKRLARWQARRDLRRKLPDHRPGRISPMRPGWPPGYRKRPLHEIDDVLRECHSLAVRALKPDTS